MRCASPQADAWAFAASLCAAACVGAAEVWPPGLIMNRLKDGVIYESTWGASITPWPNHPQLKNLVLRPEFRWDWSDRANAFGQGHENQLTLAMDVIYKF
jgi:hypothetical protein